MKNRLLAKIGAVLIGAAVLTGCDNVPEKNLLVMKDVQGQVSYKEGPFWSWECGPTCTSTKEWVGRRYVQLPLNAASEAARNYKAADGYIDLDLTVAYELGDEKLQRDKWFIKLTEPEAQYPRDVDAVVRSTISNYNIAEILNAHEAKKNEKLSLGRQIHVNLHSSDTLTDKYGVDPTEYAVFMGNFAPLRKTVEADLMKQRESILRTARSDAQGFNEKAASKKAEVDGKFADYITKLSPAQQQYLETLEMTGAIKGVGMKKGQTVDITLVR